MQEKIKAQIIEIFAELLDKDHPVSEDKRHVLNAHLNVLLTLFQEDTTQQLVTTTEELVKLAESQKLLAERLDRQTHTLIRLTRWLVILTAILSIDVVIRIGHEFVPLLIFFCH